MFGSRELVETERRRADRAEARVAELEKEVRRLTDLLIELKRDGYAYVPEPEPIEPDPLDDQVAEVLKTAGILESDPTWHHNARHVRSVLERDPETDRDELVDEIKKGEDVTLYLD